MRNPQEQSSLFKVIRVRNTASTGLVIETESIIELDVTEMKHTPNQSPYLLNFPFTEAYGFKGLIDDAKVSPILEMVTGVALTLPQVRVALTTRDSMKA